MGETTGQFSGSKEWGKLSGAKFFKNPPQKTYLDIMSFNMYIEFFYTYIHIIFCLLSSDNLQVLMLPFTRKLHFPTSFRLFHRFAKVQR